jgi:site-specific DNA-methyltransferase (adenine-specific)
VKNLAACMSSDRMDWETPLDLFQKYDDVYRFDLDAAAVFENAKVDRFIGPPGYVELATTLPMRPALVAVDALAIEQWPGERCWLNPPYGRDLPRWYAKAKEQATEFAKTIVMLVPARTDTSYWHEFVWDARLARPHHWVSRIDFLKGRVRFVGAEAGAPFPSAVITMNDAAAF